MIDMTYLQQDAYDAVDVSVPDNRQKLLFTLLVDIVNKDYDFQEKPAARDFFMNMTSLLKNLNYSPLDSHKYKDYYRKITAQAKLD